MLVWLPARQCVRHYGAPCHYGTTISDVTLNTRRGRTVRRAALTNGVIMVYAFHGRTWSQCMANGANGEDMVSARELAAAVLKRNIASATIQHRRMVAIIVSASASSTVVAVPESVHQTIRISGMHLVYKDTLLNNSTYFLSAKKN